MNYNTSLIRLGVFPILGVWLGCNAIIGLEPGNLKEVGSGGSEPVSSSNTSSAASVVGSSGGGEGGWMGSSQGGSGQGGGGQGGSGQGGGGQGGGGQTCDLFAGDWAEGACERSCDGEFNTFFTAVGATVHLDFETRGDLVTPVQAGEIVPSDEYLGCCGVELTYEGSDPTGHLIWTGNMTSGFKINAHCESFPFCSPDGQHGIRMTFSQPVSAVAGVYGANTELAVFDTMNVLVASHAAGSSGRFFLGYTSPTPLGSATFLDSGGEFLADLWFKPCP